MNNEKIKIELTELEALKLVKAMAIARQLDKRNFDPYFDIAEKVVLRFAAKHEYSAASCRTLDQARTSGNALGNEAFDAMEDRRIRELYDAA